MASYSLRKSASHSHCRDRKLGQVNPQFFLLEIKIWQRYIYSRIQKFINDAAPVSGSTKKKDAAAAPAQRHCFLDL
jgi:hypothetical protein